MNAVQTRTRRCSSRLAHNVSTQPQANASMFLDQHNRSDQMWNCNQGNSVIYDYNNVHLRPIPFYDINHEIIKAAGLISDGRINQQHESQVQFKLTIDQADQLASNPNTKIALLRFCYLDSTSEQDDNFPPEAVVLVNGINIVLPQAIVNPNKPNQLPKRPGQHVDITKNLKLCPYIQNLITVKWIVDPAMPKRSYVINVTIVDKVSSDTLLARIKERGLSDPEQTKKLILDSDNEVSTTNLQSSLVCPLGKMRMSVPCKSKTCRHITCFDALFYIQMNERKASWTCPVCYKPAYFNDLMIDGFFMSILENSAPEVTEVTLNLDGSWSPVIKSEQLPANKPVPEIITISDDDD